ncbi:hypothetical protein A11A3_07238 [Alcanivorax hongdengensis A-11-3]|uniref:DUF2894 domain-containing protein n=1 Tax=Alcanivorax hongdengensis A-11-3 TaxID=1177179 RepID=L0WDE5_9GAMM|nr:DUF2894 domain-containing protein [Alcanivorax hongdengensis]EKF74798.1 hypothetical protein A11A3_07238 [Alcanivorax hongdengensis A-11-3]
MTDTAPLQQLEALRQRGEDRFDPVRFHYLQALAQRLHQRQLPARRQQQALGDGLQRYCRDLAEARARAEQALPDSGDSHARALFDRHDYKAALRQAQRPTPSSSPLAALLQQLVPPPQADDGDDHSLSARLRAQEQRLGDIRPRPARGELKALRQLREARARQQRQARIERAINSTPSEAGPLNSHRLVTRSLETLREISPAYLNRFASYMETLMWLEKNGGKGGKG